MADPKFFLDTGALIALAGLEGSNLQLFKKHIEESNSKLSITHIQVNEKHRRELQDYQRRIDKALESLTNKGIVVQIEPTKIALFDVSRFDLAKFSDEETGKLCDKLRKEIDQCEKVKARIKNSLNIACDAVIAISSFGHDFFITSDRCLFDSWRKVIGKHKMLRRQVKVPKVIYSKPNTNEVAKRILELLLRD